MKSPERPRYNPALLSNLMAKKKNICSTELISNSMEQTSLSLEKYM